MSDLRVSDYSLFCLLLPEIPIFHVHSVCID